MTKIEITNLDTFPLYDMSEQTLYKNSDIIYTIDNIVESTKVFKTDENGIITESIGGKLYENEQVLKIEIVQYKSESHRKLKMWCNTWDKLKDNEKQIIFSIYGESTLKNEIKDYVKNDKLDKLKRPKQLLDCALYIYKSDLESNKICSRCNGTGKHSYNQLNGDTCFKCHGDGKQLVNPNKTKIKAVMKQYPNGYTVQGKRGDA